MVVAAVGTALVLGYAALALVQILYLKPLAAAPSRTLAEIHSDLAAAGESLGAPMAFVIMGVGPIFAVVILGLAVARRITNPWVTALIYLAVLTVGPGAYFVASFGAGMSLADTYGISGGDDSPWARPFCVVSLAAAVSLVAAAIVVTKKSRFAPPSDRVANVTLPDGLRTRAVRAERLESDPSTRRARAGHLCVRSRREALCRKVKASECVLCAALR